MEIRFKLTKKKLLVGLPLLLLLATGAALAAWLISANGNATGKAATLSAPTVISGGTGSMTGDLFPGSRGSLNIQVTNNNPVPLQLIEVEKGTMTAPVSLDTVNCPSSNVFWGGADAPLATPVSIPTGTNTILIPAASFAASTGLMMNAAAPTGCQGVSFTLTGLKFDFSS